MKYVHGLDEKGHDRLMVLINWLIFAIIMLSFSFFLGLFFLVVYKTINGKTYGLRLLFFIVPCIVATLSGLHECLWRNSEYCLDEKGITLRYLLHSKQYPWSTFQRIFTFPLRRGVRVSVKYDYIVLMISECEALTRSLSVPDCHKYLDKFLVIRSTEERIREFSRYCTISDRPDFKAYK